MPSPGRLTRFLMITARVYAVHIHFLLQLQVVMICVYQEILTVITLPTNAAQGQVFLHATGLTTAFTLPGITTTLAESQGFAWLRGEEESTSAFYIRPCLVCQKTILEEEL